MCVFLEEVPPSSEVLEAWFWTLKKVNNGSETLQVGTPKTDYIGRLVPTSIMVLQMALCKMVEGSESPGGCMGGCRSTFGRWCAHKFQFSGVGIAVHS